MLLSTPRFGICLLVSCVALARTFGQDPQPRLLAADLLEDASVLRRVYEAAHPGLYRYNTKAGMDNHFAALRHEFARDRTLAEAYIAFSQFLSKVQCGHTYANFSNQSKGVAQILFAGKNRVPFCFRWISNKMIITRNLSAEPALKPGTEVVAINGIKASGILTKLMTVGRADGADGANGAKRVATLEVRGTGGYEAFDVFLPLFYPTIGERMKLLILESGSKHPITLEVAAQDHGQRKALPRDKPSASGEAGPLWKFEQLENDVSYLRMPTWALYNSKWDWRSFLERGVDALVEKRVDGLIIDLRGNEGGLDVGNTLIARITKQEIRGDNYRRFTRYRTMPEAIRPYLETWDKSFLNWGEAAKEDRDGFFRMTRYDDRQGEVIAPTGKRYPGQIVVLTDASNSSATFQFAQTIKENKLATLVGQTTGGNQRGINGGAFFFLKLPNSKIEVDLPLIATFKGDTRPTGMSIPFLDMPDAGIEPDIRVPISIDDIARNVDSELEAAKAFLKNSNK